MNCIDNFGLGFILENDDTREKFLAVIFSEGKPLDSNPKDNLLRKAALSRD